MKSEVARPWIIRALVVALLAGLVGWIANNTHWEEISVPMPLKGEARTNPQYAQRVFLESLGVHVESHQSLATLPPKNGVIYVHLWHWDLIASRRQKLEEWVRNGGRLVVDTSLIDSLDAFSKFSGIKQEYPKRKGEDEAEEEDQGDEQDEEETEREGNRDAPKLPFMEKEQCAEWNVTADSQGISGTRKRYAFCGVDSFGWLVTESKPLWAVSDKQGYQAARVQIGKGSVTVLNDVVFDNAEFRDDERGALFVAVGRLQHDDSVWLLTESEHPSLLTLVWRYGAPVVLLFGLFVAAWLWRNGVRFGSLRARPVAARRSLAEQIRGTGWFLLRLGGAKPLYKAMLRSVKEEASRRIARFASFTPQQQLDALVARTGVDRDDLQHAFFVVSFESTRQNLYKAIALLETVRRVLQHDRPAGAHIHTDKSAQTSQETQEAPHAN